MRSAETFLRTGDRGDSVVAPWVPICAGGQRVPPLSFWLLFRCTLNNQTAEHTPQKVFTNPDPVNRFRPKLVAEQMTAQKQQGNVIWSAQILQLENVIAALKHGMNIREWW